MTFLAGDGQHSRYVVTQQQALEKLAVDLPLQLPGWPIIFGRFSQVKLSLILVIETNKRFIVRPAQLRPQCRRNWERAVELAVAFQLSPRKLITKLRLQLHRQALDEAAAVSGPVGPVLLFLQGYSPKMPVGEYPSGIDNPHCLLMRLRDEAAHGGEQYLFAMQVVLATGGKW